MSRHAVHFDAAHMRHALSRGLRALAGAACLWAAVGHAAPSVRTSSDAARPAATPVAPAPVIPAAGGHTVLSPDLVPLIADRTLFPVPAALEPNRVFWRNVYGTWSVNQIAFHDRERMGVVYLVADVPGFGEHRGGKSRRTVIKETKKALLKALETLEKTKPTSEAGLTGMTLTVYRALKDDPHADKYRREDTLRAQNGLRERFVYGLKTSGRYAPMIRRTLRDAGLPEQLIAIAFVESLFAARARSHAGAAGIWQFMPATAKETMHVNSVVDERYDPSLATASAAIYLDKAYRLLGAWPLAITSYNYGRGGMHNAVLDVGSSDFGQILAKYEGKRFGFAARNYYAEFLAALDLLANPTETLLAVQKDAPWRFDVIRLAEPAFFADIARASGTDKDVLAKLNPALNTLATDSLVALTRGHALRVPLGTGEATLTGLGLLSADARDKAAGKQGIRHIATGRERVRDIARRYRVSARKLARTLKLRTRSKPRKGRPVYIAKKAPRVSLLPEARGLPVPPPVTAGGPLLASATAAEKGGLRVPRARARTFGAAPGARLKAVYTAPVSAAGVGPVDVMLGTPADLAADVILGMPTNPAWPVLRPRRVKEPLDAS